MGLFGDWRCDEKPFGKPFAHFKTLQAISVGPQRPVDCCTEIDARWYCVQQTNRRLTRPVTFKQVLLERSGGKLGRRTRVGGSNECPDLLPGKSPCILGPNVAECTG
jgi:hypothetical protein